MAGHGVWRAIAFKSRYHDNSMISCVSCPNDIFTASLRTGSLLRGANLAPGACSQATSQRELSC